MVENLILADELGNRKCKGCGYLLREEDEIYVNKGRVWLCECCYKTLIKYKVVR